MRLLAAFLLIFATLPAMAADELLLNNDFAEGITHWRLNRSPDYGYITGAEVQEGVLHLTNLKGMKPYYMNLVQPVDIKEGQTYQLSFEYKGQKGSRFGYGVGDHQSGMLSAKGTVISSSGWQKVKFEFTAQCSTDSQWFKKARSYAAKSELEDGRTVSRSSKKAADLKNRGNPGVCNAALSLGALEGDFQIRKFSLVAVD